MQIHLNTRGTYLHIKDQLFEVKMKKDGVPFKQQIAAFKVKSIWISEGVALSSDAVKLALKNNIDIVFLEYDGFPIGRVWHSKLGSTTKIRKRQLEASCDERALLYVKKWLSKKLGNQAKLLTEMKKHRTQHRVMLSNKIAGIERFRTKIEDVNAPSLTDVVDTIRGWEGTAGRFYFEAMSDVLPRHYRFAGRSYRPAKDVFNAMLNYGYGYLYSRIEKALMLAGLDPFVGFMHRDDYNHKSMVHDFIEPYRCYVDKVVFSLFAGKKVKQSHYDVTAQGITLNVEGKPVLIERLNQYFEVDRVRYKGRLQTRANAIQWDAHEFANELLGQLKKISL